MRLRRGRAQRFRLPSVDPSTCNSSDKLYFRRSEIMTFDAYVIKPLRTMHRPSLDEGTKYMAASSSNFLRTTTSEASPDEDLFNKVSEFDTCLFVMYMTDFPPHR